MPSWDSSQPEASPQSQQSTAPVVVYVEDDDATAAVLQRSFALCCRETRLIRLTSADQALSFLFPSGGPGFAGRPDTAGMDP